MVYIKTDLINSTEMLVEPRVYKISHFYDEDVFENALFLETRVNTLPLLLLLVAIQFKFEELIDDHGDIQYEHISYLLEKYYDIKDVSTNYKNIYSQTIVEKENWEITNTFILKVEKPDDIKQIPVVQIDLYQAREFCCGKLYHEIMANALPLTAYFENDFINLKKFYV